MHPNPAARLAAIFDEARRVARPQDPAMLTWAAVFKLPGGAGVNEVDRQFELMRLLGELHVQLQEVRRRAASTGLRAKNYEQQLGNISQALLPNRLYAVWQDLASFLNAEALLALNTLADLLGDDELPVPADALSLLLTDVAALEQEVRESTLDAELKSFVFVQLDAIRAAVRDYPIRGASALQDAYQRAMWEWGRAPASATATKEGASVVQRMRRLVVATAAFVVAAGGTLQGVSQLVTVAQTLLTEVPKVAGELGLRLPGGGLPKQLPAPAVEEAPAAAP